MSKDWLSNNQKMNYEDFDEPVIMDASHYDDRTIDAVNVFKDRESDGFLSRFLKGMRACWATKQTEDIGDDRELLIKTTLRELIVYLTFLVVLMIITFGTTNGLSYYYTNALSGLFLNAPLTGGSGTYAKGASITDYWNFLTGPLLSGLYWNQYYGSIPVSPSEVNYILYENQLIGVPRLRQVRINNNTCTIANEFKKTINNCFDSYSRNGESTSSFGPANSSAWNYISEKDLGSRPSLGSITTYGGGGFYVDLNKTQSDSLDTINFLFNNLWIDKATRAVILDFTIYNSNINMFCVIKLVAEFPPTGGMIPNFEFRTVKLIRYVTPMDYLVMACELMYIVFIIYYIIEELIEIRINKLSYFCSFWNCLDIVVVVLSVLSMSLNIYRTVTVQSLLTKLLVSTGVYPDFDYLSSYQIQFNYSFALTLLFAWVKVFKYISFNKTMTQMSETIARCSKDLLGFAVLFFLVFFSFAQLGYLLFGSQLASFQAFGTSVYTLYRVILGDSNFSELNRVDRVFGPLFFMLYVFFVFFLLFNMFTAIIIVTYAEVKESALEDEDQFKMGDYFKERAQVMLSKLNIKIDKIIDLQSAMNMADTNDDNIIDFEEWKAELKLRGFVDEEIERVFVKYDINGDRTLDQSERVKMQEELENQKSSLGTEKMKGEIECAKNIGGESVVSMDDYYTLSSRVDRMDATINTVVSKIELVLKNIGNIEQTKSKRRETVGQILETLTMKDNLSEEDKRRRIEGLVNEEIDKMNKESGLSTTSKSQQRSEKNVHGKY